VDTNKNLKSVIRAVLVVFIFSSCSSYKMDSKDLYRNAAKVFVQQDLFKGQFNVYEISKFNKNDTIYVKFLPELDNISIFQHQRKGRMIDIPTDYVETENKLFLIYSKADHYNKNVLNKIHEYKYLDSTLIKAKLENRTVSDEDWPELTLNHSIKAVYYEVRKGINGIEFAAVAVEQIASLIHLHLILVCQLNQQKNMG
jgi:hypothetical protein|tara:strand:- start:33835 stop:34431 length:597 start_codon:yes stop_codon:yes gene_type:complete